MHDIIDLTPKTLVLESDPVQTELEYSQEDYYHARNLDPLELDRLFKSLPEINRDADTETLIVATRHALQIDLDQSNVPVAIAAMRDYDFLLSSLLRHGVDPLLHNELGGLQETLLALSGAIRTVPRGTVSTYATANPEGERRRSFTGEPAEDAFIDAVARSAEAMDVALASFSTQDLTGSLQGCASALDVLVKSIVDVRRTVSPEFFTNEMRPYFDPLYVDGTRYLGAGGAQLQLLGIDYVLWGIDSLEGDENRQYRDFFEESIDYLTPVQRDFLERISNELNEKSIITYLTEVEDPVAAEQAHIVLNKIRKFRYPHRKIAQDNFKLRKDGAVGSGAYTPDILDELLLKTHQATVKLEEHYQK